MSYSHITQDERVALAQLIWAGKNQTEIAKRLGKEKGAISREIQRNKDDDGVYRGNHAQKRTIERRTVSKAPSQKITNDRRLRAYIIRKLKKHWSPEQIAGKLKQVNGKTQIAHETIYLWIYSERPELKKHLRSKKGRYRRKRGTNAREEKRDRAKVKRIDERPQEVDLRTRIGDWEGDTVIGGEKTTRIATNVDRYSGYGFGDLMHIVSALIMHKTLAKRFALIPHAKRHTYTYDNGTELGEDDAGLEAKIRMDVYRAYPYHSWERGTNENWNGLLCEFFPKKMCFATLTQADVDRAVKLINHRPRKRLGYLTPYEVFVLGKVPPERKQFCCTSS